MTTPREKFVAALDELLAVSFDQDWPAEQQARAAVLQAYDEAAGREGHGVMPANLAHKLQAFAAEPEGTTNWKMIAWSIHRMLNAQPLAAAPKRSTP